MKVGRDLPTGPEVPLPIEIIETIVTKTSTQTQRDQRQQTLWACCLLSKAWYSVAVKELYHSPVLTTRNFDLFARTLCPPVNSHVRSVGLETFVHDLDMGHLAYESTKSLTARLLRRTRASLETFVAPSVSFSSPSLAPLSKAENLRALDLSNDFYDFDLSQLLWSLRNCEMLRSLSLPKGALRMAYMAISKLSHQRRWPPSLSYLQVNYKLPENSEAWRRFLQHLPQSLRSLSFDQIHDYRAFDSLMSIRCEVAQVAELHVGTGRRGEGFNMLHLLYSFNKLKVLTVPAFAALQHDFLPSSLSLGSEIETFRVQHIESARTTLRQVHYYVIGFTDLKTLVLPDPNLWKDMAEEAKDVWIDVLRTTLAERSGNSNTPEKGLYFEAET